MEHVLPALAPQRFEAAGIRGDGKVQGLQEQIERCRARGARGFALFSIHELSLEEARQLGEQVFVGRVPTYRPGSR